MFGGPPLTELEVMRALNHYADVATEAARQILGFTPTDIDNRCAMSLYYVAIRSEMDYPSITVSDFHGMPKCLQANTCPRGFLDIFERWAQLVPVIQRLSPQQQDAIQRLICNQPPRATYSDPYVHAYPSSHAASTQAEDIVRHLINLARDVKSWRSPRARNSNHANTLPHVMTNLRMPMQFGSSYSAPSSQISPHPTPGHLFPEGSSYFAYPHSSSPPGVFADSPPGISPTNFVPPLFAQGVGGFRAPTTPMTTSPYPPPYKTGRPFGFPTPQTSRTPSPFYASGPTIASTGGRADYSVSETPAFSDGAFQLEETEKLCYSPVDTNDSKEELITAVITSSMRAARELHVWSKCKHPHIVPLLGLVDFQGQLGMVSPWMKNGDLHNYVKNYPATDRFALCIGVADALAYLHGQVVVHGDLKGPNVLISDEGRAMLIDFGNADLKDSELNFTTTMSETSMTLRWTAPEIFGEGCQHSVEGDVYALGMTILETFTGKQPYCDIPEKTMVFTVLSSKNPDRPNEIPVDRGWGDGLWELLTACWEKIPAERPSASQVHSRLKELQRERNRSASVTSGYSYYT